LADRYRIERELGRGGMATVYLAQDLKHDRPVALKVLRPEIAAGLGTERFLREIRLTARLQHPHILSVFDSGAVAGRPWYTMPYVRGESLRERLRRELRRADGCGYVSNLHGWGKKDRRLRGRVLLPMLALPSRKLIALGLEWRGQSRVSPTSQRRRDVPCKRLIRDSAGLAALALVNQTTRESSGDGSRSSQGHTANASVRRWPREEERGSEFPDSG
jgi:protein kinase-like protein